MVGENEWRSAKQEVRQSVSVKGYDLLFEYELFCKVHLSKLLNKYRF